MSRTVTRIFLIASLSAAGVCSAHAQGTAHQQPASPPSVLAPEARIGEAIFAAHWLPAPDVSDGADGLGPLFSATSCRGCHAETVVGVAIPQADRAERMLHRVVRIGDQQTGAPDPIYGRQIQERAIAGQAAEAQVEVAWESLTLEPGSGRKVDARRPVVTLARLAYGNLAPGTRLSLRRPPALAGAGVIEAIPDQAIVAGADPDDRDGDGISGRANQIGEATQGVFRIGRFGWRASAATLVRQTAEAFSLDMGLSSPAAPAGAGDCTLAQRACMAAKDGASTAKEGFEVSAREVEFVAAYLATRRPPAPSRLSASAARAGAQLAALGCAVCHRPGFDAMPADSPPLHSDLLLHDMGEGLADAAAGAGDSLAREWRTAPLWGLSAQLAQIALGRIDGLMHDGRARTIEEAIAWHGGEASTARERFFALSLPEQSAFLDDLGGL